MADLLECLLQIKGLRETADSLAALARNADDKRWRSRREGGASALELLARLAGAELIHGTWLCLMLKGPQPAPSAVDLGVPAAQASERHGSVADSLERFLGRRRDNLELLDRCSADDLGRTGSVVLGPGSRAPGRRTITIADLVALMLANDVERLGEIRRALGG